jgi:hypothetical protein
LIVFFARLIRWAIVCSGTRKAAAISAVVSPATARRVRAIAAAGVSAGRQRRVAAHEHQQQGVVRLASARGSVGRRRQRLASHRLLPIPPRRFAADAVGHPPRGDVDQPAGRTLRQALGRPLPRRVDHRLLHRVLGVGEVAEPPRHRGEGPRRRFAQQALDFAVPFGRHTPKRNRTQCVIGAAITSRTSITCLIGRPPGPGAADPCAAISTARSTDSTSMIR